MAIGFNAQVLKPCSRNAPATPAIKTVLPQPDSVPTTARQSVGFFFFVVCKENNPGSVRHHCNRETNRKA
jgi:hypothetical protein